MLEDLEFWASLSYIASAWLTWVPRMDPVS